MNSLDVSKATHAHNAAFVSSIRTYGNLGPFRPADRSEFKGIRLFDMLLRPNQIVCGSTIRAGDSDDLLYGNWGVIIGSGTILQAFPYDAASYVSNGEIFSPYSWRNHGVDIETQVSRAIEHRSGYNEVDIALGKHSIAGLFFGDKVSTVDGIDLPSEGVLDMIRPLRIPAYRLERGQFYQLDENGTPGAEATQPVSIIEHEVSVPEHLRLEMVKTLTERLLLPPRNAVSAGLQFGQMSHTESQNHISDVLRPLLLSGRIDQRYFGSMAVYAAELTALQPITEFSHDTYSQFVERILPNGTMHASRSDIEYYLSTGNTPEYFGKI